MSLVPLKKTWRHGLAGSPVVIKKTCEKMEKYGTVIAPILILSGKLKQNYTNFGICLGNLRRRRALPAVCSPYLCWLSKHRSTHQTGAISERKNMTYPVLSAISPDKSLQVASSPSFQIIFMVHPHIFLIEAPFFHHHEFSMIFLSLTLWSCPACWKIHRGWTLQGEKPAVQQVILGQLLPYINSKSIYKSIKHT